MKILGYEINEGTFQDRPYKNVYLYVQSNEILKDGKGFRCLKQKIKYETFVKFLNENKLDWDYLIGLSVNIYFNQYGNVEFLSLI